MAGQRILYFTTKGKFTSKRVWKSLTSRGFSPRISIPDKLTPKQEITYNELSKEYDFYYEDDNTTFEIPNHEIQIYDEIKTIEKEFFEEDFLIYDDLLDELDDIDEFVYIGGNQ